MLVNLGVSIILVKVLSDLAIRPVTGTTLFNLHLNIFKLLIDGLVLVAVVSFLSGALNSRVDSG